MKHLVTSLVLASGLILTAAGGAQAAAVETVSLPGALAPGDDQTTGNVNFGFSVNFSGVTYTGAAVNTNGNLSFGDGGFGQGTPSLSSSGRILIAPFWADVDTRGSGTIQYGAATLAARSAFVVTYSNVGSYLANTSRTNTFQVILFDRADTGAGNFDVEFNYDRIQWESGSDSGGVSAVAGLDGTQLPGSLTPGAFLDGGPNSLVANSLNARNGLAGRYDFNVRNGSVINAIPEPASLSLIAAGALLVLVVSKRRRTSNVGSSK